MDLINFLVEYFTKNGGDDILSPFLSAFNSNGGNNFDFFELLKTVDLKSILPLVVNLFKNNGAPFAKGSAQKTEPILGVADKEILSALNQFFSTDV